MENIVVAAATDVIIFILYVLRRVINSVFCLYTFTFVSLLPVCIHKTKIQINEFCKERDTDITINYSPPESVYIFLVSQ